MTDKNLELFKYLAKNDKEINKLFDRFIEELAKVGIQYDQLPTEDIFKYSKYPQAAQKAVEVAKRFREALTKRLNTAISGAINLAFRITSANFEPFSNFRHKILDEHRKRVIEAFMAYRVNTPNGMSLSDRVWNYTEQTKAEFELGLSQVLEDGIRTGESAEEIGRKVRGKLNDPDAMWRRYHLKKTLKNGKVVDVVEWRKRVVDATGKVHFVKTPLSHPGPGVYRSARQNALRMAATEINMAYRYMDNQRYQSEPFVIGIRINLSGHRSDKVKNFHDMCDDLVGDYPKWFLWSGWHPRCKCFMTSILCSEDEMRKIQSLPEKEYRNYKSPNLITEMPDNYDNYLAVNEDRINRSIERGTQPYWIRDNYVDGDTSKGFNKDTLEVPVVTEEDYMTPAEIKSKEERVAAIQEAARKRHAARTPEKEQMLRDFAKTHKEKWEKTVEFIGKMTARSLNIDEANALGSELTKAYLHRKDHSVEHLLDLAHQIQDITFEYDVALVDATDIAIELDGISDIDIASVTSSSSIKGLKKGTAMLQEKKAQLMALTYIDNPIEVAKRFSFKDAVTVNSAVMKKIEDLKVAIPPSSFTGTQLEYQAKKLKWEADEYLGTNKYGAQDKYPTWQVSQNAYYKRLAEVEALIEFEKMQSKLDALKTYKFKWYGTQKKFNSFINEAQNAIVSKDKDLFEQYIASAEKVIANSEKKLAGKAAKLGVLTDKRCLELIEEFEKCKDESMDDLLRPQTRDAWLNLLTKKERVILTKYTQTYNYLNEPLRNIHYYGSRTDKDHDLPILTRALSKVKAPKDMVVRRGVGDYPIPELGYHSLSDLNVGDEFIDGAFLSTAVRTDMGFHQTYNLVIVVPKGSEGIYAEPFSHYTGATPSGIDFDYEGTIWDGKEDGAYMGCEREWIGQRGSKFKVIKKKGHTIYLKMIGQMFDQPKGNV